MWRSVSSTWLGSTGAACPVVATKDKRKARRNVAPTTLFGVSKPSTPSRPFADVLDCFRPMMRVIRAVVYTQCETAVASDPRLLALAPSGVETLNGGLSTGGRCASPNRANSGKPVSKPPI
jgi:hypothetical protein